MAAVTDESRLELLTRLKAARRTRLGRRGDLGSVVAALYRTADLMDTDDRRRERYAWQQYTAGRCTRRPRPPFGWPADPGQLMQWGEGFLAAYGLNSQEQWDEVRVDFTAPGGAGHKAWKAWVLECRAVYAEMEKLLLPKWLDSPNLTAADVRAIADRVAAEGEPQ